MSRRLSCPKEQIEVPDFTNFSDRFFSSAPSNGWLPSPKLFWVENAMTKITDAIPTTGTTTFRSTNSAAVLISDPCSPS